MRQLIQRTLLVCGFLAALPCEASFAAKPTQDVSPVDSSHWLRNRICKRADLSEYGLRYEKPTSKQRNQPALITLHGFNSKPASVTAMLDDVDRSAYACGHFAYANDQSLEVSARHLASELKSAKERDPQMRFCLVTHSMGGLVARRVVEDPRYDPGNVSRLIMVAPPNHGSQLAKYAVAVDTYEHWIGRRSGSPWSRWKDSIIDGMGEAADELKPGSKFLTRLNAGTRNRNVQYTVLLGTDASMLSGEVAWLRRSALALRHVPGNEDCANRVLKALNGLDECVGGAGDGVVAVRRGKLAGVDDVEILHFGHLSLVQQDNAAQRRLIQQAIARRLEIAEN